MKGLKGVLSRTKSTSSSDTSKKARSNSSVSPSTNTNDRAKDTAPQQPVGSSNGHPSTGTSSYTFSNLFGKGSIQTAPAALTAPAAPAAAQERPEHQEQYQEQYQQQQQQQQQHDRNNPPTIVIMNTEAPKQYQEPHASGGPSPGSPTSSHSVKSPGEKEVPKGGAINRMKNTPKDAIPISRTPRRQRSSRFHVTEQVAMERLEVLEGEYPK
ncbi:hypothetical protein BGZ99_000445 [Dissophora globulifera]|uniref:Uncharacterized protein n=1 Tax=Dissophora globulifera TaxID=979702 RepID=A0A9P6RPQ8_9FUNG|nr:hypothetical protein BGZ99_000445 [Dissophora globulifera]